jgi:CBS domain-containing protein
MKVKNVMTKDPSACVPSDTAPRAARIMRDEDAGFVPVIENEQSRKVVGVVTDRDLCMNVVAEGRDPNSVEVGMCMTTSIVTCSANDSVSKVTELMKENQIRRVVVVDDEGRLQAVVAMADLVGRAEIKTSETHDTLKKISEPTASPSKPRAKSAHAA